MCSSSTHSLCQVQVRLEPTRNGSMASGWLGDLVEETDERWQMLPTHLLWLHRVHAVTSQHDSPISEAIYMASNASNIVINMKHKILLNRSIGQSTANQYRR